MPPLGALCLLLIEPLWWVFPLTPLPPFLELFPRVLSMFEEISLYTPNLDTAQFKSLQRSAPTASPPGSFTHGFPSTGIFILLFDDNL